MNSFEKIKAACDAVGIPAYPDFETKGEDTYAVYNYSSEYPDCFGDDAPEHIVASLQLHLYLPGDENFYEIRKLLRSALFEQDFTFPSISLNTVEDNNVRHITFEFEDDEDLI